jgi:hypothetical protein
MPANEPQDEQAELRAIWEEHRAATSARVAALERARRVSRQKASSSPRIDSSRDARLIRSPERSLSSVTSPRRGWPRISNAFFKSGPCLIPNGYAIW